VDVVEECIDTVALALFAFPTEPELAMYACYSIRKWMTESGERFGK